MAVKQIIGGTFEFFKDTAKKGAAIPGEIAKVMFEQAINKVPQQAPEQKQQEQKQIQQKAETFQILRDAGKSMHNADQLAGFKGNSVRAADNLLEKIKKNALTDPKLLKTSKKVAKHILEIAENTLKNRKDDPSIQTLCVKSAMQIIEGQQDRIEPKKNLNFNANVNANLDETLLDYSKFRRKD